jgi:hypothetical protein
MSINLFLQMIYSIKAFNLVLDLYTEILLKIGLKLLTKTNLDPLF